MGSFLVLQDNVSITNHLQQICEHSQVKVLPFLPITLGYSLHAVNVSIKSFKRSQLRVMNHKALISTSNGLFVL